MAALQGLLTHQIIVAQLAVVELLERRGRLCGNSRSASLRRSISDPYSLADLVTLLYGSWSIMRDPSRATAVARGTTFRYSGALYGSTIEQMGEGRHGALPRRQPRWSEFLWASCVTTPPVASRFLLPWLSPGETGESYVSSSLRLYTHPLLRHSSILPAVKASGGHGE